MSASTTRPIILTKQPLLHHLPQPVRDDATRRILWMWVWILCAFGPVRLLPVAHAAPEPATGPAEHVERVTFRDKDDRTVTGKLLVEAGDGGLLLLGQDSRLWTIEKNAIIKREPLAEKFRPLSPDALGDQLRGELGAGFEVGATKRYVICSNAGKAYSVWCGSLFERLFGAFQNYWKQRGIKLTEPEFPLIAIIFADQKQFAAFSLQDTGSEIGDAKGYYSIATNRMVLYDLTGARNGAAESQGEINRRLSAAPFNIATIIHEATHQIAFNSGMHTRLADNPLWLVEGMAMFFETPDLTSKSGWKTVGAVNALRQRQFQEFSAKGRGGDSLASLLKSDARFTDPAQMGEAYCEAWALSYFLIKTRKEAYVGYLNRLAAKPRLAWDKPDQRLSDFKAAFGDDLTQLETEWLRYMRRLSK